MVYNKINKIIDTQFIRKWKNYVFQSLMVSSSVLIVLIVLHQQNFIVSASMAGTAFTLFVTPHSITASRRNVLGGYTVGILIGSLFSFILTQFKIETVFGGEIFYAFAVGISTFTMAITNTEHPPAAATTLGLVLDSFSFKVISGILIGVIILVFIHWFLQPILHELTDSTKSKTMNTGSDKNE